MGLPPRDLLNDARAAYEAHRSQDAEASLTRLQRRLDGDEQPEATLLRAEARALRCWYTGDRAGCLAAQEEVITLLRGSGDAAALARALVRDAGARMASGAPDVQDRLDEALEQARAAGDLAVQAEVWTTQAMVAERKNQPGEAVIAATAGAAAARRCAAWHFAAVAQGTRASALSDLGDLHSAIRAARDALKAAVAAGASVSATDLRVQLALLLVRSDELAAAANELAAAARDLPSPPGRLRPRIDAVESQRALAEGDLPAARAAAARAAAGWRELGDGLQVAEALLVDLEVCLAEGDLEAARARLADPELASAPAPLLALARARAALHLPDLGDAGALALQAAETARGYGAQRLEAEALDAAVLAAWRSGDLEGALQAALALAAARKRHSERLREVRAAAQDAAARVAAEVRATLAQTGLTATQDEAPDAPADLIERAAHDIRNALATVSTSAELLAEPEPPLPRAHLLARLLSAVDQAQTHLERAILDARQGRIDPQAEARLTPLAHRVVSRYADEARARGIGLTVRASGDVSAAAAPSACRDALSQLVRNGVLYCGEGDTVRVDITSDDDMAIVKVIDDGPGMPADRLAAFAEGRISDAGLGISMVVRSVTGVGGSVQLEAEDGGGTTVTLRLPRS